MNTGKNRIKFLLALIAVMALVLTGCTKKTGGAMTAGEYTVEVTGMKPMTLKVTLSETEVTAIDIVEHSETPGLSDEAIEEFPKRIIESQDLSLDTVSGATITSEAIIEGVKKAITEAGGDPATFGEVSGDVAFKAGKYEGSAEAHNGKIVVEVEVSETEILSVSIIEDEETEHLSKIVYDRVPKQIVEDQSLNVDSVSGATISSQALVNAVKDAVKQAGVDPKLLDKPATKELSTEVVELETDTLIVGGGSAGLSAALTSDQSGADVIIIEKSAMYGGHTALSGGYTFANGSEIQKELGVTNDTNDSAFDDVMANGGGKSDPDMLRLFVDNIGRATDWTLDYVGALAPDKLTPLTENEFDRALIYKGGGIGLTDALVKKLDETEVKQYLDTKAEELIVEDGKVVGVIAKNIDGTTYNIKAKSVVLATGGHGARKDLLPEELQSYVYYGASLASGDGVELGLSVGAGTSDMGYVELFENGVEWKPGIAKSTFNGTMAAWDTGGILVDRDGKRVVNERGMGPDIVAQQAKQDDARLFMLMDQSTFDAFEENIGGYGISQEMLDGWLEDNGKNTPYFAHADTIEAVSEIIGVNAENLKATIERYNTFVEAGKDDDFGRDPKYMTQTIGDGPYYLVEQLPRYATTLGGLTVNTKLQVLNESGAVIEGLYAVGDTAAGVRGDNSISGSDVAWAVASGFLIGEVIEY